jgi:hypothetical protein
MRALRRSPLFRIALLILAVLFARSAHAANVRHSFPAVPPCPRKVAAAQPDLEKNPALQSNGFVRPGSPADRRISSGGFFSSAASAFNSLHVQGVRQTSLVRRAACITPQRRPFALRI